VERKTDNFSQNLTLKPHLSRFNWRGFLFGPINLTKAYFGDKVSIVSSGGFVATPNTLQNRALGELLSWSICPDMAGDKWILHYISYNLEFSSLDKVGSIFVVFVDKFSTTYQCYTIDVSGNIERNNFNV
jgi:hypothetical protein